MIRTLIIEDEKNSREVLRHMLDTYCSNIEIIGEAENVKQGINLIKKEKPELLLLDVEIKGGNSFQILKEINHLEYKIIFITGYDQYAIQAIKFAALDYILKPIDVEELKEAIIKVKVISKASQSFIETNTNKKEEPNHIVLMRNNQHHVIPLDDINYLEANRSYTIFHTLSNGSHIGPYPISYYEDLLPDHSFFRIHKSYLVHKDKVEQIERGRGGEIKVYGNVSLPIAIRRKSSFLKFINQS